MTITNSMIVLELISGGYYSGTPEQCLTFLAEYKDLVKHEYAIDRYFHWSETKESYVSIEGMHPTYIRNVLLKDLHTLPEYKGRAFIEDILTDNTLEPELVGEMYRLWCEMFDVPWNEHRDALLSELESGGIHDDFIEESIIPQSDYKCEAGTLLL